MLHRLFSSFGKQELFFDLVPGLFIAVDSHVAGAQALGYVGSIVAAPGLWSTGSTVVPHGLSYSTACGIFPDQGSNPCLLYFYH